LYVVHGFLHLVGYDDHDPRDRRMMRCAERRVMRRLNSEYPLTGLFVEPRGEAASQQAPPADESGT